MADAYLNIAERVLAEAKRPMRPREIILYAYEQRYIASHLHGERQDKTLHARLSENIAQNPDESRFFRAARGVFFLEALRLDKQVRLKSRDKFLAPPRRKELRRNSVMQVEFDYNVGLRPDGSTIAISKILDVLKSGKYCYEPIRIAKNKDVTFVIKSFVIIYKEGMVLSFRCGKYFINNDPLFGNRTIGIGSAVYAHDNDLLYESMYGIIGNGINELRYGIGLPGRLAEDARYNNRVQPFVGVAAEEAGIKFIHVVLLYRCPDEFLPSKSALSINDLRWLDATNPANSLDDFDTTSRVLFEQDIVRDMIFIGGKSEN